MNKGVVCIHIGARAHYLLPKALNLNNNLEALITDTWMSSALVRSLLNRFPARIVKSFSNRFSPHIPSGTVHSFSIRFLIVEIYIRFKFKDTWEQIIKRNYYFERIAASIYQKFSKTHPILSISYTALTILQIAKVNKQKTVLFQIDPGYKEEQIVAAIVNENQDVFATTWKPAPAVYWQNWKKECELADVIMVNSEWSRIGLLEQGIEEKKIKIVPLPFQLESKHIVFKKSYPDKFNKERPLRLLFLGTLTLRKGIHIVLGMAKKLAGLPVEIILVGESELRPALLGVSNIKYNGVATRAQTDMYYQEADVFLFPTLSDGFGLTQLEAMAWKLPVIASTFCGDVVVHNYNGITLEYCTTDALVKAVHRCLDDVSYLSSLSANCLETVKNFSLEQFAKQLSNLIE